MILLAIILNDIVRLLHQTCIGVFKTTSQEDVDAYVDLKGVNQLYNVEVKLLIV